MIGKYLVKTLECVALAICRWRRKKEKNRTKKEQKKHACKTQNHVQLTVKFTTVVHFHCSTSFYFQQTENGWEWKTGVQEFQNSRTIYIHIYILPVEKKKEKRM